MEDKRLFARIIARFPLKFLNPNNGQEGTAETIDISANGLGLLISEPLPKGTFLELWLQIPDHHQPLYTQGEVTWQKVSVDSGGQQRLGIHLSKFELMGLARALWLEKKV